MSTGSMSAKRSSNRSSNRSSPYLKLAVVILLAAAVAAAAYVVVEPVRDFFSSVRVEILSTLGLGVLPIAGWLAVFIAMFWARREWLHPRLWQPWLGSAVMVTLAVGVMGFFQPDTGVFGRFTLEGSVSLGGQVGTAIIGSASITGALRLIGIFILGMVIVSPQAAKTLSVAAVVAIGVAAGWAAQRFSSRAERRRSRRRSSRAGMSMGTMGEASTLVDTAGAAEAAPGPLVAAVSDAPPFVAETEVETDQDSHMADEVSAEETGAALEEAAGIVEEAGAAVVETYEDAVEAEAGAKDETDPEPEGPGEVVDVPVPVSRFNRFWSEPRPAPALEEAVEESEVVEEEAAPAQPEPLSEDASLPDTSLSDDSPDAPAWAKPSIDLLEDAIESEISEEEISKTAETIVQTLMEYGIEVEIGRVRAGPTVTMYGIIPGWVRRTKQVKSKDEEGRSIVRQEETNRTRVKVDSILSREKDLALALKTPSIRIETPAMGTSQVGIEVPNPSPSLVGERMVMESDDFKKLRTKAALPVALGKGSGGETEVIDLARMPHLLIAGSTGSGKSVCLNAIISCLLMEKSPEDMRLLLIDPKRVELTPYNGIPHLLTPVVVETDQVVGLLKGLIQEMMDRYRMFERAGARNIEIYNEKAPRRMPYLVVAVDELADLMMTAAFDVEQSLCRLAQMGRATGIHLIIATQRPSVDVVTGLIKANFPSRIAFAVSSQVDSRTILDTSGADKLLGRGDMLYLPIDASTPRRIQNVFISDGEIGKLVEFWKGTPRGPQAPVRLRAVQEESEAAAEDVSGGGDELLDKAIELGLSYSKLSTSLLQRRLRIGYPRAARLKDELEERGVIGPSGDVIINHDQTQ